MKHFLYCIIFCCTLVKLQAQQTQPGFVDEYFTGIWLPEINDLSPILGVTFDPLGKMYLWSKEGKVYAGPTQPNSQNLMLDISSKVYQEGDAGMLGFALDPNYLTNGYIYVYYAVKPELIPVAPDSVAFPPASMGRVERYKVANPHDIHPTTDYGSPDNIILIGESASTGIPITYPAHMGGTLVFGTDGSLLLSTGDGAIYGNEDNGSDPTTYYMSALASGIMTEAENIGSNRSQMIDSHCGKLLRFNPTTGDGLPSNPFYESNNPRSARSRVWALGLRNPFRIMHIPLTGNHTDDPGDFLVGDVGQGMKEEFNLASQGGQNFGWPHYEGMTFQHIDRPATYLPNNPTLPIIDYRASNIPFEAGRAIHDGMIHDIGSNEVPGPPFMDGASAIAGLYYDRDEFPAVYKNSFFVADAMAGWIYNVKLDPTNYNVISVSPFVENIQGSIVSMAIHPIEGSIYYVRYGDRAVNKIYYSPGNRPPIAKIKADTLAHNSPVVTAFTAIDSYDLDNNEPLTYEWDFGDGSPIQTGLAPHHVFVNNNIVSYKVKLTVTDPHGAKGYDSVYVDVNNTAPTIQTSTIHSLNQIPANQSYPVTLNATVGDDHTSAANLVYVWKVMLAHNDHEHLLTTYGGNNQNVTLPALVCELGVASYWYRIYLEVMDAGGLKTTYAKDIFPDCGGFPQNITFNSIGHKLTTDAPFMMSGSASSGLPLSFYLFSGPASVGGNTFTLTGRPGYVTIRAAQHGNGSNNQAPVVSQTFWVGRPITNQTVSFNTIPNQSVSSPPIVLSASASSGQVVDYLLISGPATLSGNTLTLTGQPGTVRVRAIQQGSFSLNGAYVEQVFTVGCPASLALSMTIENGVIVTHEASNNITATNLIKQNTQVLYRAGQSISLNPGFQVTSGAIFTAQIGGCN